MEEKVAFINSSENEIKLRKQEKIKLMKKEEIEQRKKIICNLVGEKLYVPMKEKELAVFLQVKPKDRSVLKQILEELLAEGRLVISKRGKYSKPLPKEAGVHSEREELTGVYLSNSRGFGFVEVEGREEDLFIPEGKSGGAFHKDKVQVELLGHCRKGKRQEAKVIQVLERSVSQIVGVFEKSRNFGFVIPDQVKTYSDIFIPADSMKDAGDGDKVVVELTDYGDGSRKPEGKVTEILGHVNDPGVDILSVVRAFGLPEEFGEKVLNQAARVSKEVSEADRQGRLDLREVCMVTIDGEDAKDLDDAVSLSKEGENYRLGVHIADVANYVQENSALDQEALERGTSVYLVDRVIPMLPHALSNHICSLNEGQERLALSCIMLLSPLGEMIDYQLAETVIRVKKRMTYTAVREILEDKNPERIEEYKEFCPMLFQMEELAALFRSRRKKRGSIDFDFPESKILLTPEGVPVEVTPYESNTATKIIEEFMLQANEVVAQHFYWLELPFLYRTHDNPDAEKIMQLGVFIRNFGHAIKISKEEVHPKEIQNLLAKIEGTPHEALISRLALRSMKRARYSEECTGHFGLASPYYCHFTSPIRRYPDLQIHRIIKEQGRGRLKEERIGHYESILPKVAKKSSERERRADEAEREVEKLKKIEYMESRIGEIFDGVISGITGWGIYVELPNTIEGLIHVAALHGDYYQYDERNYEMVGKTSGIRFQLGQKVKIKVKGADRWERTIDFSLCEEEED